MEIYRSHEAEVYGPAMDEWDPWNPPYPLYRPTPSDLDLKSHAQLMDEYYDEIKEIIAMSRRTNIIIPDRTPQEADDAFYDNLPHLFPLLEKDSVRRFLRLFCQVGGCMEWGFIITPLTFTQMVKQNALRCAKVVLDGKAPELLGYRANPNCMNRYGYFPLHQAAEMFSVDMVKLLFSYGASANLRTAGAEVIQDLLPLHVAVENTCMHKYLEENAFLNQEDLEGSQANLNYICKLIHILCLPEMKIFLDTTRLLAENTANLVDELWNYIKDGKLVQTAVLLLAAQEQIRGGPPCKKKGNSKPDGFSIKSSCKKNGNGRPDGFSIIINRILTHTISLVVQIGQNRKKNKELEIQKRLTSAALLLVRAVLKAGKVLDTYIQSHPEVARNRTPRGWELKYTRRSFFPYWRSVLRVGSPFKVVRLDDVRTLERLEKSWGKPVGLGSSQILNPNLDLLGRTHRFSNHHPKRMFCSAALALLKVFRNARV